MPELEQKTFQKRQVAYKVRISDILDNVNISRVNIIATIVYKSEASNYNSAVIDDGTGRISLRSFENNAAFSKIDVGDTILIIGKIRKFNDEKYIMPEIFKKINNMEWLNLRKLELRNKSYINDSIKTENKDVIKEAVVGNMGYVYSVIKKLDTGDGVSVEDVIKTSNDKNTENVIKVLLENGDVFEIRPGKLKVLE